MKSVRKIWLAAYLVGISAIFYQCGSLQADGGTQTYSEGPFYYEQHIRKITKTYCITCHSGEDAPMGLDLTTYENVREATENGPLIKRINDTKYPMPQSGLLPKYLRTQVEKWAENGYIKEGDDGDVGEEINFDYQFNPPTINAVNIDEKGFEFFNQMKGHWVGDLNIMGDQIPWFAFDYRPISSSHIHGIFEGGTMGNLFTSFFVADYKGTPTIMARNGGILNGIYRTSYFVLDKAEVGANQSYYRLVDAYGGKDIMWMELTFKGNELYFNSYTSRFGLTGKPSKHMVFKGKKMHTELAEEKAQLFGYPKREVVFTYNDQSPTPDWGEDYGIITSASYLTEDSDKSLIELGELAKDPWTVDEIPHLSALTIQLKRGKMVEKQKVELYLSMTPLTNEEGKFKMEYGYIKQDVYDGILTFPEVVGEQDWFTFYYLHPGAYYLTAVADVNGDGYASEGDIVSPSFYFELKPETHDTLVVDNIEVAN